MSDRGTELGGARRDFPPTTANFQAQLRDPATLARMAVMETLAARYWKPVYHFLRMTYSKSNEDAKDLAQAFFARVLQKGLVARARPERGSFRAYLKRALRNFLIDAQRSDALRRPKGVVISLDAQPGELERLGPAAPDEPPDRAYDREWFNAVVDGSIEALRLSLERDGKAAYFEVFRIYCLEPEARAGEPRRTTLMKRGRGGLTHREVAARLGISETDVGNYLTHCRAELRRIMKERVRAYVADDRDVEAELREVMKR